MSRYLADCSSKFYEYARVPLGGRYSCIDISRDDNPQIRLVNYS